MIPGLNRSFDAFKKSDFYSSMKKQKCEAGTVNYSSFN